MTNQPLLTIITVSWNSRGDLGPLLRKIRKVQEEIPFEMETVVVDNASSDGTPEFVEKNFPWVRLIRNEINEGFALGCNRGIEAAEGKFLLLLNPDCIPAKRSIAGMVRYLERHPKAGAVGCLLLHEDGLPQPSAHREPSPWSYLFTHSMLSPLWTKIRKMAFRTGIWKPGKHPRRVAWLMGSCLMTRREVVDQVGMLEPSYFMYSEDTDWCRRMRKAGWQVRFLPQFRMIHRHGTSAARKPEWAFRRLYRSMLLYSLRQHSPGERRRFLQAVKIDLMLRRPVYLLMGRTDRVTSLNKVLEAFRYEDPSILEEAPPGLKNANATNLAEEHIP